MFSMFMETGFVKQNGITSVVTMQAWMFLSSYEKMRIGLLSSKTIISLMHMENMVMRIAFGTAVTVFRNTHIKNFKGVYNYIKLQDIVNDIPFEFPVKGNRYSQTSTDNFSKIPGEPIAYWVSEKAIKAFDEKILYDVARPRQGMATTNNELFLRFWQEV